DPQKLMQQELGKGYNLPDNELYGYEFPLKPEQTAQMLRRLIAPPHTLARPYDPDGKLLLYHPTLSGGALGCDPPPPPPQKPGILERTFIAIRKWLARGDLPVYRDIGPGKGTYYSEVVEALKGEKAHGVYINDRGQVVVLVAVPIQSPRTVRAALLLSTQGG